MRMDRRAGLLNVLKLPTLAELFADAVAVGGGGANRSSATNAQFRFPKDTNVYLLCFHGTGYTVGKLYNTTYTKYQGTSAEPTVSSYSSTEYNVLYSMAAGSMVGVTFPSYSEKIVQAVLTEMQQQAILSGVSSPSGEKYVQNSEFTGGGLYVAAHGSYSSFSISAEESLFTPIFSYTTSSYTNRVYMYRSGTVTYLSVNGTSAATNLFGGRIARLY